MRTIHIVPRTASAPNQMSLPESRGFPGVAMAAEMSGGGDADFCAVSSGAGLVVLELFASKDTAGSGLGVGFDADASLGKVGTGAGGFCGTSEDCWTFC